MKKTLYFLLCLTIHTTSLICQIKKERFKKMKLFYKNLPVLVTGGAGFIGSHITQKLVELGAQVTVIDNLSTGNIENLKNIKQHITFIEKDIINIDNCVEATRGQAIIFHLAAFISVPESIKNPAKCHEINVNGTFNILHAAQMNNVQRFVFSSSSAIYGSIEGICKETMTPHPESPYGTSKLIGEYYCKQFADNFGLHTVALRYFNVFGERQNPNGAYAAVIAKFKNLMKQNKPVTIFGDGLQTRDFIPVANVVEANLTIAMLPKTFMNGQVFNIATGKSINLLELIDMLKKEFPLYNQEILFQPARIGDIKHSSADCSKYKSIEL